MGVADKDDAAVVGDIKPFMTIGGPGIGGGIVGGGGPEAEGAIDVDPGIGLFGELDEFGRVEGAGVDVAGLETDESGLGEGGKGVGTHAALGISRNADDAVAAEAEHGEGFEQGDVSFLADEDGEVGGGEEAEGFDIVAVGGEQRVAGGGKAGEVGHGGAADEGADGGGRDTEEIRDPAESDELEFDGGRGHDAEGGVLVPNGGELVGGEGGGKAAAGDEAEVAAGGGEDGGGGDDTGQQGEDFFKGEAGRGESAGKGGQCVDRLGRGEDTAGEKLGLVGAGSGSEMIETVH